MIRALTTLVQEQAELLREWRSEQVAGNDVALLPRPADRAAPLTYGRVSAIVASDPAYGPHLLVVRQAWSGTPPVPADVNEAPTRCYPTPNRAAADYAVGELVRIESAHGVTMAARFA